MRSDFCTFLLAICPCLREYGNTSFIMSSRFGDTVADSADVLNQRNSNSQNTTSVTTSTSGGVRLPSDVERLSLRYQPESSTKRLLHSISRAFHREKHGQTDSKDEEIGRENLGPKLKIDTPD